MIGGTRSVPVLITGCSSGIGRAAALSLHAAGLAVYATARQVDVLGLVRLTQLVLPGMRHRGRGRILNVSSMGGRITLPGGAFYHASKYAVEALSNALRMEVAQFGIDVVLIEPGPVKTPWNDVAAASLSTAAPPGGAGPSGGAAPAAGPEGAPP